MGVAGLTTGAGVGFEDDGIGKPDDDDWVAGALKEAAEFFAPAAHRFFRLLALRDIEDGSNDSRNVTLFVAKGNITHESPGVGTGGIMELDVEEGLAAFQDEAAVFHDDGCDIGHGLEEGFADHFLSGAAAEVGEAVVDADVAEIAIDEGHADGSALIDLLNLGETIARYLLAVAQSGFGVLALGDVAVEADAARIRAVGVAQAAGMAFENTAVFEFDLGIVAIDGLAVELLETGLESGGIADALQLGGEGTGTGGRGEARVVSTDGFAGDPPDFEKAAVAVGDGAGGIDEDHAIERGLVDGLDDGAVGIVDQGMRAYRLAAARQGEQCGIGGRARHTSTSRGLSADEKRS